MVLCCPPSRGELLMSHQQLTHYSRTRPFQTVVLTAFNCQGVTLQMTWKWPPCIIMYWFLHAWYKHLRQPTGLAGGNGHNRRINNWTKRISPAKTTPSKMAPNHCPPYPFCLPSSTNATWISCDILCCLSVVICVYSGRRRHVGRFFVAFFSISMLHAPHFYSV